MSVVIVVVVAYVVVVVAAVVLVVVAAAVVGVAVTFVAVVTLLLLQLLCSFVNLLAFFLRFSDEDRNYVDAVKVTSDQLASIVVASEPCFGFAEDNTGRNYFLALLFKVTEKVPA